MDIRLWILLALAVVLVMAMAFPRLRSRLGQHNTYSSPPTLPKGSPILLGILISSAIGYVFAYGADALMTWTFPKTYGTPSLTSSLSFAVFAMIGAGMAGLLLITGFKTPGVPIGWKAIPLILGFRSPIRVLLPEGVQWSIPLLFVPKQFDTRGKPLIEYKEDPELEEVTVMASAKIKPPDTLTPPNTPGSNTTQEMERFFSVPVVVKVTARRKIIDPYRYSDFDDVDGFLYSLLQKEVRVYVRRVEDAFKLPDEDQKDAMTKHLESELDKHASDMGVDFVKLAVTEIVLPKKVTDEGENLLIEWIQRSKEKYQAETLAQTTAVLKQMFPTLGEKELKNMVLTAAGLAKTTTYSFEGNAPFPVLPVNPGTP